MSERPNWQTFDSFYDSTHEPPLLDSERFVSYSINDLYPTWQEKAHCADVGHEYFFGDEEEQPTMSIKAVRRASKLCDVCPVYRECLRWALEKKEEYGVWAGTSGRVRRKIQRHLEDGTATVDQVVEDFANGRRDAYISGGTGDHRYGGVSTFPSRGSVRDEASWPNASGDR